MCSTLPPRHNEGKERESCEWELCRECRLPVPRLSDGGAGGRVSVAAELEAAGWYYGSLPRERCAALLAFSRPGTFLVRDSSDPRYLFALSLQTGSGPLSVRVLGCGSAFRLEADPRVAPHTPVFSSVVALVQHYSAARSYWIDWRGSRLAGDVKPVRPLYRRVPALRHLARLALNRTPPDYRRPLPSSVQSYLDRYPYTL